MPNDYSIDDILKEARRIKGQQAGEKLPERYIQKENTEPPQVQRQPVQPPVKPIQRQMAEPPRQAVQPPVQPRTEQSFPLDADRQGAAREYAPQRGFVVAESNTLEFAAQPTLREAQKPQEKVYSDEYSRPRESAPQAPARSAAPKINEDMRSKWEAYRLDDIDEDDGRVKEKRGYSVSSAYAPPQPDYSDRDYNCPEDADRVLRELNVSGMLYALRIAMLTLCAVAGIYLALCPMVNGALPLPAAISYQTAPQMYAFAYLLICIISIAVCIVSVGKGLIGFFTLKANGDTMAALTAVAAVIYTLVVVINPQYMQNMNVQLYGAAAVLALWFNTVGASMRIAACKHNLSVLTSGEQLCSIHHANAPDLLDAAGAALDESEPLLASEYRAGFLTHFIAYSKDDEPISEMTRVLTPICFVAAVGMAVGGYFIYGDIMSCFTVLVAVLCVCTPLTSIIAYNLPLLRSAKALSAYGGMINGFKASDELSETTAITINAAQLFPEGSITMHGIRTFKGGRIDTSILEAASVMEKVDGTMKHVFSHIIEGNTAILEDVDEIAYEEGLGLSAWVNSKRVLIGSRELMRHHGVELPPRDYELKFTTDGRDIVYLASDGELSAMFVVSYSAVPEVSELLYRLGKNNITILVKTTDPNLTRDKLSDVFNIDYDLVRIMPATMHSTYDKQTEQKPQDEAKAASVYACGLLSHVVLSSFAIKKASSVAMIMQLVSIILGYGLTVFVTLFFGISIISPLIMMTYQLVWALIIMLAASGRRYT